MSSSINTLFPRVTGPEVSGGAHEVVDCAQTHKSCNGPAGPQSQRMRSLSISALSLEEQRILQSLERLNQRLQCQFHFKFCTFNPNKLIRFEVNANSF